MFTCFVAVFWLGICRAIGLANCIETEQTVNIPQVSHSPEFFNEYVTYCMGKSLFDLREYRRAAHTLEKCTSDEAFFLRYYSLFLVSLEWYLELYKSVHAACARCFKHHS